MFGALPAREIAGILDRGVRRPASGRLAGGAVVRQPRRRPRRRQIPHRGDALGRVLRAALGRREHDDRRSRACSISAAISIFCSPRPSRRATRWPRACSRQAIEAIALGRPAAAAARRCQRAAGPPALARALSRLAACGLFGAGVGLMLALALFFVGRPAARAARLAGRRDPGRRLGRARRAGRRDAAESRARPAVRRVGRRPRRRCAAPPRSRCPSARPRASPRRSLGWMALALAVFVAAVCGIRRRLRARGAAIGRRAVGARAHAAGDAVSRRPRPDAAAARSTACSGAIPGCSRR